MFERREREREREREKERERMTLTDRQDKTDKTDKTEREVLTLRRRSRSCSCIDLLHKDADSVINKPNKLLATADLSKINTELLKKSRVVGWLAKPSFQLIINHFSAFCH